MLVCSLAVLSINPAWSEDSSRAHTDSSKDHINLNRIDFSEDHDNLKGKDPKYAEVTSHCPSSNSLRKALKKIRKFPPIELVIDDKKWIVNDASVYAEGMTPKDAYKLPLFYDAHTINKTGKLFCIAQFHRNSGESSPIATISLTEK